MENTTRAFYKEYMSWSRAGFPVPLPEALESIVSDHAKDMLIEDSRWYGEEEGKAGGEINIQELEVLTLSGDRATTRVKFDDKNVTFTVKGRSRTKPFAETIVAQVELVYSSQWRVDNITQISMSTEGGRD